MPCVTGYHPKYLWCFGVPEKHSMCLEKQRPVLYQQYKLKYFLKRRFPFIHDQLVTLKRKLKK